MQLFKKTSRSLAIFIAALAATSGSFAQVVLSGNIVEVTAPYDFSTAVDEVNMLFLQEKKNVALTSPLNVHVSTTGSFVDVEDITPATLAVGSVLNSYYVTNAASWTTAVGSITFSGEIIVGVIGLSTSPGDGGFTNAAQATFGFPAVNYGGRQQGIDLQPAGGYDSFAISADRTQLTFEFFDAGLHDDFRIITMSAAAIPEPSTYAAMAGLGALGLAAWRKRRQAGFDQKS